MLRREKRSHTSPVGTILPKVVPRRGRVNRRVEMTREAGEAGEAMSREAGEADEATNSWPLAAQAGDNKAAAQSCGNLAPTDAPEGAQSESSWRWPVTADDPLAAMSGLQRQDEAAPSEGTDQSSVSPLSTRSPPRSPMRHHSSPASSFMQFVPRSIVNELAAQLLDDVYHWSADLQDIISSRLDAVLMLQRNQMCSNGNENFETQMSPSGSDNSNRSPSPGSPNHRKGKTPSKRSERSSTPKNSNSLPTKSFSGRSLWAERHVGALGSPSRRSRDHSNSNSPSQKVPSFNLAPPAKGKNPQGTVMGARRNSNASRSSSDNETNQIPARSSSAVSGMSYFTMAMLANERKRQSDDARSVHSKGRPSDPTGVECMSNPSNSTYQSAGYGVMMSVERDQRLVSTDLRKIQGQLNTALLSDHCANGNDDNGTNNKFLEDGGHITGLHSHENSSTRTSISMPSPQVAKDSPKFGSDGRSSQFGSETPAEALFFPVASSGSRCSGGRPKLSVIDSLRSDAFANSNRANSNLSAMINIRNSDVVSSFMVNLPTSKMLSGNLVFKVIKFMFIAAFVFAGPFFTVIQAISAWSMEDSKLGLIYDTILAIGTSLSLAVLMLTGRLDVFGHSGMFNILKATDKHIAVKWRNARWRWMAETLICMPVFVMSRAAVQLTLAERRLSASGLTALGLIGAVFIGQVFYVSYIIKAMEVMIDAFCFKMIIDPCCRQSICDWNTLQAMLRSVSNALAPNFVSLFTTVLVLLLLVVNQIVVVESASTGDILSVAAPLLLLMLTFFRLLCQAAEVSGKCLRVPPFVNSLIFDRSDHIDHERQYLVTYISNSAAGFYIFDIHVTTAVTFKAVYLLGAIIFFVITKFTSGSN